MIRVVSRTAAAALLAALLAQAALAGPAHLPDLYTEPTAEKPKNAPAPVPASIPAPVCHLTVVSLEDGLQPRDIAGNYFDTEIMLPANRQGWMRSVLGGLARRGIAVDFADPGAALPPGSKPVAITFKLAYIDFFNDVLNATVGIALQSADPAKPFETYARGDGQRAIAMGSPGGRGADAINLAASRALDKLAARAFDWCKEG